MFCCSSKNCQLRKNSRNNYPMTERTDVPIRSCLTQVWSREALFCQKGFTGPHFICSKCGWCEYQSNFEELKLKRVSRRREGTTAQRKSSSKWLIGVIEVEEEAFAIFLYLWLGAQDRAASIPNARNNIKWTKVDKRRREIILWEKICVDGIVLLPGLWCQQAMTYSAQSSSTKTKTRIICWKSTKLLFLSSNGLQKTNCGL